jgi:hypothetical protein
MAFRGVYDAPEIKPTSCGLLSVARVMTHSSADYDERWIRGFSYVFDTQGTLRILTTNDEAVSDGELFNSDDLPRYKDCEPFFIEVEDFSSTFGLLGVDRIAKIKKQLAVGTQKAVEKELWDGVSATAATNSNTFLSKASSSTVSAIGAFDVNEGLYYLEQSIAESPLGEQGIIHMTRDVASALGSKLSFGGDVDKKNYIQTRLGTPVVVGSGYSGNGPVGSSGAAASATNKWMYATGPVDVHLGKIEVVNENLGQGIDATINDMRLKATRPAGAYFDPSIHYTVRVTLPTP